LGSNVAFTPNELLNELFGDLAATDEVWVVEGDGEDDLKGPIYSNAAVCLGFLE
jgi:hypothetical protein